MGVQRSIARIASAVPTLEGDGVQIRRVFPTRALHDFDPFLLLDEMGPLTAEPGAARGFPPHPHRGFETVTYMLEGDFEHRDSSGNHGRLTPGAVQWMTAGSGVVHSEMPGPELLRQGGRMHGFQLWVNLPRAAKMSAPRYQDIAPEAVPVAAGAGVSARVIAGEALGVQGAAETRIPITYLHLTLAAGAEFTQPVPAGQSAFIYVVDGQVWTAGQTANAATAVLFADDGDAVALANPGPQPASVLLVAAAPLKEPVARGGPFVMNTEAELRQAFEDYQSGRMGRL
jgi:redox-sensitive bicupin YhaK (pirin superfamily)